MKDLFKNGIIILLVIGVLYIIFLRECKKPPVCPAKDEIVVKKNVWDSIMICANMPPVHIVDTFIVKGDTVYINNPLPKPKPDPKDSTINDYSDSLVNDEINVWIDFKVRGELLDRRWKYIPITKQIVHQTTYYVPKIVNNPVPISQRGLYGSLIFGGNQQSFLFGGNIDYITKKDTEIGYVYQRFGNMNFHSIKIGAKIKIFKR